MIIIYVILAVQLLWLTLLTFYVFKTSRSITQALTSQSSINSDVLDLIKAMNKRFKKRILKLPKALTLRQVRIEAKTLVESAMVSLIAEIKASTPEAVIQYVESPQIVTDVNKSTNVNYPTGSDGSNVSYTKKGQDDSYHAPSKIGRDLGEEHKGKQS